MSSLKKYRDYKTILSVNALIWCDGKVLLLKRSKKKKIDPGVYSGIGGKVEPGEDFYAALLREIKEETGLTKFVSIRPYSVTQHPYPPSKAEWVNLYFNIQIDKQVEIPDSEDGEFHWVNPNDISKLPIVFDLSKYIKILVKNPNAFMLGRIRYDKDDHLIDYKINVM
jgi:8-oxo-dGTP diphosphatase